MVALQNCFLYGKQVQLYRKEVLCFESANSNIAFAHLKA